MSWDIYGNTLTRGHCEVHPHVHEEYPCSVCIGEKRTQEPQYCDGNPAYCENSHYLGQAQEHIKELESHTEELALQLARKESAIKSLVWSEPQPANEDVRYDHVTAETPFGNFLITWKSWKEYDSPTIDETPWGYYFDCANTVDAAKQLCEEEYERRLRECLVVETCKS